MTTPITIDFLLKAYASGYFPMALSRGDEKLLWFDPDPRGIIPLDGFHVPRSLRKFMRSGEYTVSVDRDFAGVIQACAETDEERKDTWINAEIIRLYTELHQMGYAHSVECWRGEELIGGLYGVALGGAFFGESMFSRATNASKVALVHLVERLIACGYTLLDAQYLNEHLIQFGAKEIPKAEYQKMLEAALKITPATLRVPDDAR